MTTPWRSGRCWPRRGGRRDAERRRRGRRRWGRAACADPGDAGRTGPPRSVDSRRGRSAVSRASGGSWRFRPARGQVSCSLHSCVSWASVTDAGHPRVDARRLRAAMDAQIPQLLDLLAAASSAGLSAQLSLRRAVDGARGPLAAELGEVRSMPSTSARVGVRSSPLPPSDSRSRIFDAPSRRCLGPRRSARPSPIPPRSWRRRFAPHAGRR